MGFLIRLLKLRQRVAELEAENRRLMSDVVLLRDGYNSLVRDLKTRTSQVYRLLEKLEKVKAERDAAMSDIDRCCATCSLSMVNNGTGTTCRHAVYCDGSKHWVWRGAKGTNETTKTATDTNVGHKEEE